MIKPQGATYRMLIYAEEALLTLLFNYFGFLD